MINFRRRALWVATFVVALTFLGFSVAILAGPGFANQTPVLIHPTTADKGDPTKPSVCKNKISGSSNALGSFYFDIKNNTKRVAKDFHVKLLVPQGDDYKIEWIQHTSDFDGGNESRQSDRQIGVDTGGDGANDFAHDAVSAMGIKLLKKDSNDVFQPHEATIEICVWLTRNAATDEVVSAVSPTKVGDTLITATTSAIPGVDVPYVSASEGSDEVTLSTIAIAEVGDYRFGSGTLMIMPDDPGARFQIPDASGGILQPMKIEVYDESGNLVCNRAEIGMWNPRIDEFGNFLIDVWRNKNADSPCLLAVRNLRMEGLATGLEGKVYTASMSGAPMMGMDLREGIKLVEITAIE